MSGGTFGHSQYNIQQIAEDIERVIEKNNSKEVDEYGDRIGKDFKPETIREFKNAVQLLKIAYTYAQRVDYLLAGDDGEETFHKRLVEKLLKLKQ